MDHLRGAFEGAVDAGRGAMGRAKELVGIVDNSEPIIPEEPSFMDEFNQACSLTYKQRLYGFASCLGLGLFCTLLSMLVFFHPIKFSITYSVGNLLAMGSTGFLIGFLRQLKLMFDPIRFLAAVIFVVALLLTLLCALLVRDALLTLLLILVQESALLWYSLSYIPFAQAGAQKLFHSCFNSEF